MNAIPNDMTVNFGDPECRRTLMEKYGDSKVPFYGANEEGENTLVSVAKDSIVTRTFQHNGWVRVNYYDANGNAEGVSYEGRWKDATLSTQAPAKEPPVSFDIGTSANHSKLYYTATKFVDTDTAPHCQAIHYQFCLTNSDNGLEWSKIDHEEYAVSNVALRHQFNSLIQHLSNSWSVGGRTDPKAFIHWLAQNCEIPCDANSKLSYTFALTDIALFYLAFEITTGEDGTLECALCQVDQFNRFYITEDPIGAALVPACVVSKPHMSEQQRNVAFASAVCSEVLSNMSDGPGIQVRLREAIKLLDNLAGGKRNG